MNNLKSRAKKRESNRVQAPDSLLFTKMKLFFPLLFILASLTFPVKPVEAKVNCHCFQDRTYSPEKKFAADGYLLITTFNSFLSKSFSVSKRDIVMMKMKGGVSADDVIIGLYVSHHTGQSIEVLNSQRAHEKSWQEILQQTPQASDVGEDSLLLSIQQGKSDMELASSITDHLLRSFFHIDQEHLNTLAKKNLSHKEITLFLLLASHINTPAIQLVDLQQNNSLSLSEMVHNFGFAPGDMKKLIEKAASLNP